MVSMKSNSGNKVIGRPREFDKEKALNAAMRVFWEKGFDGTSLADLDKAMGINRPSMYAAFGNKEELFLQALKAYGQARGEFVHGCLTESSAREGMDRLLRHRVAEFTDPKNPGGCFGNQASLGGCSVSGELQKLLNEMHLGMERAFKKRFDQAIEDGELAAEVPTANLARYYAVFLKGLALYAKAGGSKNELTEVVNTVMERWPAKSIRSKPRSASKKLA